MEKWKPVVGYEGRYEVSDLGRVRSLARRIKPRGGNGRFAVRPRVLRQAIGRYCTVNLSKDGKTKSPGVHVLVLEAFRGPRPEGKVARHFPDRDTSNNKLRNLKWGTHVQNQADRITHGTSNIGRMFPRATTPKIDDEIRADYGNHVRYRRGRITQRDLATKYGVSLSTVNLVVRGKKRSSD